MGMFNMTNNEVKYPSLTTHFFFLVLWKVCCSKDVSETLYVSTDSMDAPK